LHPGNLVGEYATEVDALVAVHELLCTGWPADDLSLGWGDTEDEEQGGEIATGEELAARAVDTVGAIAGVRRGQQSFERGEGRAFEDVAEELRSKDGLAGDP
jgi:hypothetical protein